MRLIFAKGASGRRGVRLPKTDVPAKLAIPAELLRAEPAGLPEVTELDAVRHFTRLSKDNFGVDSHFYPLGSCTMKYNPKIAEEIAGYPGFADLHPLLARITGGEKFCQGALEVIHNLENLLSEITGMARFTLHPLAGAHGELTGLLLISAYHKSRAEKKEVVLIPDSAHGTNPSSAVLAGYQVVSVPSDKNGVMDFEKYKASLNEKVAAVMLTVPNTLGIFNPRIKEVVAEAHKAGAQVYYDGANLNAILGKCRPGDIGFDVVHLNLHKTFGTPHGGGGPGAGPVGVGRHLVEFLPVPRVTKKENGRFTLDEKQPHTIGKVAPFYGNFGVLLKAYTYILLLGREGLIAVAENAVLAANYLKEKLKPYYQLPYDRVCMHECVFSAEKQLKYGVRALDIAKALIDRGFHPPTVYFPLIVKEALMIEPTETESKETLDAFIEAMIEIARLAEKNSESLKRAPTTTPVGRLNEAEAARHFS